MIYERRGGVFSFIAVHMPGLKDLNVLLYSQPFIITCDIVLTFCYKVCKEYANSKLYVFVNIYENLLSSDKKPSSSFLISELLACHYVSSSFEIFSTELSVKCFALK